MEKDVQQTTRTEPDDDEPVGRVLSRREVIALLTGLGGAALLAACNPVQSPTAQPTAQPTTAAESTGATPTPAGADAAAPTVDVHSEIAATPAGAAVPDCVVRPEETEGPYFKDEKLERSDIRSDPASGAVKDGAALALAFVVSGTEGIPWLDSRPELAGLLVLENGMVLRSRNFGRYAWK